MDKSKLNFSPKTDMIKHMYFRRTKSKVNPGAMYAKEKQNFIRVLTEKGYEVTNMNGNYLLSVKDNENNIIYFSSHNKANTNFLVNKFINKDVDYFAFYDNVENKAYMVAANKVKEYCVDIKNSIIFGDCHIEKLMIPDEWAKAQVLNTIDC